MKMPNAPRRTHGAHTALFALSALAFAGCTDPKQAAPRTGDTAPEAPPDTGPAAETGDPSPQGPQLVGPHGGTLLRIAGGRFEMGCTEGQEGCGEYERTVMPVTLTHDYYLGETEVTRAEFEAIMGIDPSQFQSCGPDCPVDTVSWDQAAAFANAVSVMEGLTECYACLYTGASPADSSGCKPAMSPYQCDGYRLPTEAEWEGAARCGTDLLHAGSNDPEDVAWFNANSDDTTHRVGLRAPNGCGLYDMSGNMYEWTSDWFGGAYYTSSGRTNPTGPEDGTYRVRRGGSYHYSSTYAQVTYRGYGNPFGGTGFRLARTAFPAREP